MWLVWTQQIQEMSSLDLHLGFQACLPPIQVRNPEEAGSGSGRLRSSALFDAEPDEEGIVANVPRRIASRKPNKQKTQSEINSE